MPTYNEYGSWLFHTTVRVFFIGFLHFQFLTDFSFHGFISKLRQAYDFQLFSITFVSQKFLEITITRREAGGGERGLMCLQKIINTGSVSNTNSIKIWPFTNIIHIL